MAIWDGIVMGGGSGVSSFGSHRICTERVVWAMPEVCLCLCLGMCMLMYLFENVFVMGGGSGVSSFAYALSALCGQWQRYMYVR